MGLAGFVNITFSDTFDVLGHEYNRGRYNRRRRDDSSDSDNDRHDGRHVRINSRPEEI